MVQNWEDRLIAKVIYFSFITSLTSVIWYEVIGVETAVFIFLIITGFMLRRWVYGKRKQH